MRPAALPHWILVGFAGLAVATLLLVAAVPRYRAVAPVLLALSALSLSTYAMIAFLAHDNGACF